MCEANTCILVALILFTVKAYIESRVVVQYGQRVAPTLALQSEVSLVVGLPHIIRLRFLEPYARRRGNTGFLCDQVVTV